MNALSKAGHSIELMHRPQQQSEERERGKERKKERSRSRMESGLYFTG